MHRYIFGANTNTKWAATSESKKNDFKCASWCVWCVIEHKHMDTRTYTHTHSIPCVLCVHFYGVVFYAVIVSPFRWFTFLNAAAAKAIILAWKFANSHIQSFHSGAGGDDNAIGIDVCMDVIYVVVYGFFNLIFKQIFTFM